MNEHINGLIKKYVLWPELQNDFQKNIYFGNVKIKDFYLEVLPFINQKTSIDQQISQFYIANEKLSKVRMSSQDVLNEKDLEYYTAYHNTVNEVSKQLLTYILVCCIVEARHLDFGGIYRKWNDFLDTQNLSTKEKENYSLADSSMERWFSIIKTYPQYYNFSSQLFSSYRKSFINEENFESFVHFGFSIVEKVRYLLNNVSNDERKDNFRNNGYINVAKNFISLDIKDETLENAFDYLIVIFEDESKFEEGYGGYAWANIARHGLNFVKGKMNAEMFVDQAFSLEHNNGNMFNKDFLFHHTHKVAIEHAIYHEEFQQHNYVVDSIPFSQVLLTAQHLGLLTKLFSLEQVGTQLHNIDVGALYKDLKYHGVFDDFGSEYTLEVFESHINNIKHNYINICEELNKVRSHIKESISDVFDSDSHCNINFQSFLYDVSLTNSTELYNLKYATVAKCNNRFFTLWNYLQNQYFNPYYHKEIKKSFSFQLYDIEHLPEKALDKNIVGGKAWGLAYMHSLGLPIPSGKVFTTECCSSYYQHPELFKEFLQKVLPTLHYYFKDNNNNPVLCSVRSGAPVSMPGMMDTVLNIGIDDSNYDYFCNKMSKKVTDNCIAKFMELFCSSKFQKKFNFDMNLENNLAYFKEVLTDYHIPYSVEKKFPLDKTEQIQLSLYAVFDSWNSERAVSYRNEKGINHDMGTAAIIQRMVFGNLNENSCTGVVFSRDCLTGENKLVGEFLPKAQGEDVVSGSVTPFPISDLEKFNKNVYKELCDIAKVLEQKTGQIQDIEFTVEDGKLYILQHRQAVCSPIALIKMLEDSTLDKNSLLEQIQPKVLQKNLIIKTIESEYANGLSANSGVLTGVIVSSEEDIRKYQTLYEVKQQENPHFGYIFYSELTSPEHMPIMNKTHGFITEQGGFTSHAAIIARSLNKPCIVGLGNDLGNTFNPGDIVTIDGSTGKIWEGEQPIIENHELAQSFSQILLQSYNIDMSEIDIQSFERAINSFNEQHKSWIFTFPEAHYCNENLVRKDSFLKLGEKIAILLAADRMKNKTIEINNKVGLKF